MRELAPSWKKDHTPKDDDITFASLPDHMLDRKHCMVVALVVAVVVVLTKELDVDVVVLVQVLGGC